MDITTKFCEGYVTGVYIFDDPLIIDYVITRNIGTYTYEICLLYYIPFAVFSK